MSVFGAERVVSKKAREQITEDETAMRWARSTMRPMHFPQEAVTEFPVKPNRKLRNNSGLRTNSREIASEY